jgi:hypothetical protein
MRWTEQQLADHLARTGAPGSANKADTSEPPFLPAERTIDHVCKLCSSAFSSKHPRHLYCEPCSESQDLKRKRLDSVQASKNRRKDERRKKGVEISKLETRSLADPPHQPVLNWKVGIVVPFSWSGSKNAIFALRREGHVALRRQATEYRDAIIVSLRSALRGRRIHQNKLWIDIFVEKSNHKGDAVNFVDLVCDAVKVATALDDRWFCLRSVDWSIAKDEPSLFICIGQEKIEDVQPCSYCGRLLAFEMFNRNCHGRHGISRVCRDCHRKDRPVTVRPCA